MRRGWTLTVLATLVALTAQGALPAGQGVAPAAANPGFYGVHQTAGRFSHRDLQRMDRGRVGTVRRLFYWRGIQPRKGVFQWGTTDKLVGDLASKGIRLLPIVYGSPRFVARKASTPPVRSERRRKLWRAFLRKAVQRYGPQGRYWTTPWLYPQQHPQGRREPIRAWQIWNEPNLDKFFTPHASVGRYVRLVRNSRRATKGLDGRVNLVLAGLSGRGDPPARKFLRRFYRARGIKRSFDGVAVNPYARRASTVGAKIRKMRRVMRHHGDGRAGLWITELGWGSRPPDALGLNKGLQGQKRILKRSFRLIVNHRRRWHVKRLVWFDFRDPKRGLGGCSFCDSAGLFRHNGRPKPAWRAYKRFTGARR